MRFTTIFFTLFILSCDYERYEPVANTNPLAECIDGHAKFELNGKEYEFECDGYDLIGYVSLDEMNADSGNDSWGWTDSSTGKEYALMGLDNGTATVSVSGSTPGYTYLWDNANSTIGTYLDPSDTVPSLNDITPTADTLRAGVYNVGVWDANGCSRIN